MKSTIISSSREENIKFPCIAKSLDSDLIVMFINVSTGIALVEGEDNAVGIYDNTWSKVTDRHEWTILDDITIRFESK